jgi:hypothetical protein
VKSRNLAQSASAVSTALISTAIDIDMPGWDRDSGFGIVMAFQAADEIGPLAAPTGLRVVRSGPNTGIASWNAVANTTSYTLKMSTNAATPGIPIATVATTSAAVSGLSRGQTYYFTVAAASAGGASPDSAQTALTMALFDTRADFDGDDRADLVVWRPGTGTWFWLLSSSGSNSPAADSRVWGISTDKPLIGDIDGDGLADLIVWRPGTGTWFWLTSSTGYAYASAGAKAWGVSTDVPLTGDIDGDGRTDLIVWRPDTGTFFWLLSSASYDYAAAGSKQWGNASLGDVPFVADFDGDGLSDLAVWRASTGTWFWLQSTFGFDYASQQSRAWGNANLGDVPLLGDFDGDRRADLAVWRASTGTWYWLTSSSGYDSASSGRRQWGSGALNDVPMLADLDGDGRAELIVWRPGSGTWFWLTSASAYTYAGQRQTTWGTTGDIPMIR